MQGVLNKREIMKKGTISRNMASLITAESKNSLMLRDQRTFLFHNPAEKENAWKTFEVPEAWQSASSGQPLRAHQIPRRDSAAAPVRGIPGRAAAEASKHLLVWLRIRSSVAKSTSYLSNILQRGLLHLELFN